MMHLAMEQICPTSQTHCKPKHQQTGHEHCQTKLIAVIINKGVGREEEVSLVKLGCCKNILKKTKIQLQEQKVKKGKEERAETPNQNKKDKGKKEEDEIQGKTSLKG